MKNEFTQENFERFLKESADDVRMRPAANVWDRIEARLNRRRRWVFLTSGFFLLTASVFGYFIINTSKQPSDSFASLHNIQRKAVTPEVFPERKFTTVTSNPVSINKKTNNTAVKTPAAKLFQKPIITNSSIAATVAQPGFTPIPIDEEKPFSGTTERPAAQRIFKTTGVPGIESVVNSYVPKKRRNKSELQLFFTPTVSYRRLTENKSYLRAVPQNQANVNFAALYDVNTMVTHKPDLGLELGLAYKYALNSQLKLRTGLQFNIMRYGIKAFTYVPERTTIALNSRAHGVDSVSAISSYRNFNNNGSGHSDWLQNFYFQVSAPIGVEFTSSPRKKTTFGIATTIQPTYVLGDRAYLLSTDYKNYSQVPWLIRRWNVNTSLETFVSYSTGKLRWQVGPQVRYQLLSSFIQQYPVKENLFDFGMKVGISLEKK